MQEQVQITFRGMQTSEAIEQRVHELASRLGRLHQRIVRFHVTIEQPHQHQKHGSPFGVRLHIGVPGREIVVDREGPQNPAHQDPYVALRDAFDAAARKLDDDAGRRGHRSYAPLRSH